MTDVLPGIPVPVTGLTTDVCRILGRNPGPMTGPGTNSFLVGGDTLCLVDPGPQDPAQFDSFMAAIGSRTLAYILVTHTHGDHSPAALRLHEATGATLVGRSAPDVPGHDKSFAPITDWQHEDVIDCGEYQIKLIHTPGHVSNHFCYLLLPDYLLFTGDHVLQGTTSVILPPDGDMADYMASLHYLQTLPLRALAPGHGDVMTDPHGEIDYLIAHRQRREHKILQHLDQLQPVDLDRLLISVYDDVAPHLLPWAKKTLLAHLMKLRKEGRAIDHNANWQLAGN